MSGKNRPISQIPAPASHNAPFRSDIHLFPEWCMVGFVRLPQPDNAHGCDCVFTPHHHIAYLTYVIYQTISNQSTVSISEHPSRQFATGHVVIIDKTRTQAHVAFVLGQVLTCLLHGVVKPQRLAVHGYLGYISRFRYYHLPILRPVEDTAVSVLGTVQYDHFWFSASLCLHGSGVDGATMYCATRVALCVMGD